MQNHLPFRQTVENLLKSLRERSSLTLRHPSGEPFDNLSKSLRERSSLTLGYLSQEPFKHLSTTRRERIIMESTSDASTTIPTPPNKHEHMPKTILTTELPCIPCAITTNTAVTSKVTIKSPLIFGLYTNGGPTPEEMELVSSKNKLKEKYFKNTMSIKITDVPSALDIISRKTKTRDRVKLYLIYLLSAFLIMPSPSSICEAVPKLGKMFLFVIVMDNIFYIVKVTKILDCGFLLRVFHIHCIKPNDYSIAIGCELERGDAVVCQDCLYKKVKRKGDTTANNGN
ncbi:hypothetical protein F8388_011636 [Cannabis sativa]|uniref:Uncharacterized protein n=1 Tax=Cannabis sativa TaxID=3483 RepID=A0A7J6GXS5_CANSA|nr:hypothetical protein F8388_011636 [Cannabis sativa]